MLQEVFMPKLGDTVEEATIEIWRKREGDEIKKGEVLLEVTTDKATLEVESLVSGTLRKILLGQGEVVPIGQVIAYVGDKSDVLPPDIGKKKVAAGQPAQPAAPSGAAGAPAQAAAPAGPAATAAVAEGLVAPEVPGRIFVSPRARRRAEEEHINLRLLKGSGPEGRIIEADIEAYAAQLAKLSISPTAKELAWQKAVDLTKIKGTGEGGKILKEDVAAALQAAAAVAARPGPAVPPTPAPAPLVARREPLTAMRRIVAERMTLSKTTAPHYYLVIEVDMTDAVALRASVASATGVKFSYNDLLAKACAIAIQRVPMVNAYWDKDAIAHRGEINIGYAVALDSGLIVPVVRNVEKKSLAQITQESAELVEKARQKRLTPDDYGGGSLTISNLGMMGVDNFIPVINPGESAILGVGRIADKVVARDGGIHIRKMMTMTLSADHRVVDGAVGAQFLAHVKALLEAPHEMK